MEFFDLQTTLTVAVILTATAAVVLFDYLRKHRRLQQAQPLEIAQSAWPQAAEPLPNKNFEPTPPRDPVHPPVLKQAAPESPLEPLIAVATPSRPPVQRRIEPETVTVKITLPSPPPDAAGATPAGSLPPFTIDAALWERMISNQPKRNMLSAGNDSPAPPRPHTALNSSAVEPAPHMIRELPLPAAAQPGGMIQQSVLDKWIESEQRFTGLVVSIGINDADSSMWHSRGLMQSVANYIASLLKAKDYCCRTAYDEFLVVCPGEQGAQSQRRLNHISERLWDYQLRGMGACSILFSWGGVQVQDQPLAEAISSATQRMHETKRSSAASSASVRSKAV
jgi:hypothetical protein